MQGSIGWRVAGVALALAAVMLASCGSLPRLEGRQSSTFLADTGDTRLGRAVAAVNPGNGTSGIFPLASPLDAFAARVLLIRAADRSLDVQYYIWHADITGVVLLEELRKAAERGVRVRLLLDDNGIAGLDPDLSALDGHPNVEVRLFNPFKSRTFKALGYLGDFERLNHRMHNKSLTADTQATIVGGRNVGDAYYGADPSLEFADLDVLAVGPVVRDVARAFDEYWNSLQAYPASTIIGTPSADSQDSLRARVAALEVSEDAKRYAKAVQGAPLIDRLLRRQLPLEWVPTRLVVDPPEKAGGELNASELLIAQLGRTLGTAKRDIDIVSPYFVPGKVGTESLSRYPKAGVRLRIVTNSLAATDVAAVHAGYAKRRKDLLRAGARLYEMKPDPDAANTSGMRLTGSSAASLHGKTFAVDRERVFVGSFNLDPRSINLNTEMGLVIDSPVLAGAVHDALDSKLAKTAFEVRLDAAGDLEWVEQTDAGPVVYPSEPKAGLGRRIGAKVLSWLPIEWLL